MTIDQITSRIIGDLLADARFTYADARLIADVVRTTTNSLRVNFSGFERAVLDHTAKTDLDKTGANVKSLLAGLPNG
jgi:hypothetical protein